MLVSELIDRTLAEWLHPAGDEQDQFDTLQTAIDADDTEIVLDGRAERVPRDSILQIGSELILTSSSSGSVVQVAERGFGGSTAAAHSVGDIVWIDPTFTRNEILNALRAIVGKLYPWGLYKRTVDSSVTFSVREVLTAPAGTKRIHSILVRQSTSEERYRTLTVRGEDWVEYRQFDPIKYEIQRGVAAEGQTMYVTCLGDFTLPDAEADDLDTLGLSETLQEDLPMAVAGTVLKGREVPRVTLDRIREALSAAGLNPGVTMNIGAAMIENFKREAVYAERARQDDLDAPGFEWQRR